jgi:hypothetical protein
MPTAVYLRPNRNACCGTRVSRPHSDALADQMKQTTDKLTVLAFVRRAE